MSFYRIKACQGLQDTTVGFAPPKPKAKKNCRCTIVPPHVVKKIRQNGECPKYHSQRDKLLRRTRQNLLAAPANKDAAAAQKTAKKSIAIWDVRNGNSLLGSKPKCPKRDKAVKNVTAHAGATYDFYLSQLKRDSLDGSGMSIANSIHYGVEYNNAFWDSEKQVMVYGDGDGRTFTNFTLELKVIAHELTHAVTEYTSGLLYEMQSGALNESMSDVMAIAADLFSMRDRKINLPDYPWLIGDQVMKGSYALRSLRKPGTAYIDHPTLGTDPQPAHMGNYLDLPNTQKGDFGGVHINSGIPNHAFYLFCMSLNGQQNCKPYQSPASIWYQTQFAIKPTCDFEAFAEATLKTCQSFESSGSRGAKGPIETALITAWRDVGVLT